MGKVQAPNWVRGETAWGGSGGVLPRESVVSTLEGLKQSNSKTPDPRLEASFTEPWGPLHAQAALLRLRHPCSAPCDPTRIPSPVPAAGAATSEGPANKACDLGMTTIEYWRPFVVGLMWSEWLVLFHGWDHRNPTQPRLRVHGALPPGPLVFGARSATWTCDPPGALWSRRPVPNRFTLYPIGFLA